MPNPPMLFSNQKTNLELLRTVGQVTYGTFWQKAMAKKLGMSQRQMIRWTNGEWRLRDDYAPKNTIGPKANLVPFQTGTTTGILIEEKSGKLWSARYDGESWIDADGDAPLASDLPSPTDFNGVTFAVDHP